MLLSTGTELVNCRGCYGEPALSCCLKTLLLTALPSVALRLCRSRSGASSPSLRVETTISLCSQP